MLPQIVQRARSLQFDAMEVLMIAGGVMFVVAFVLFF